MSIRKWLIKLNNKLEASWQKIDFTGSDLGVSAGWYIAEFTVVGALGCTPSVVVTNQQGGERSRELTGAHSGRNRMMIYLPEGRISAHSESISFERLARLSPIEAQCRVMLICLRYLRDFFGPKALFKALALHFQSPFERSSTLLEFYSQGLKEQSYLDNVNVWNKFRGYSPRWFKLFAGKCKVAVVIECESQRLALESMLLPPDLILMGTSDQALPAEVDLFIPLKKTESLRSPAILMLKRAVKKHPEELDLIYTDHDYESLEGDSQTTSSTMLPAFKPQPSRCYLACFNYIAPTTVFSRSAVADFSLKQILDYQACYRRCLEIFKDTNRVLHIPEVLFCSRRTQVHPTPAPIPEMPLWDNLDWQRQGDFNVLRAEESFNTGPEVDLIIPTRDGLHVLQPCIDSILEKTQYENFNIIVVDNGSEEKETFEYFKNIEKHPAVTIVNYPGEFNYSAINNFAVSHGKAPYVGLINNDIEVIKGDWLTHMMAWATQADVGIVGAKLLFGDGRIQHAGVTIGMGNAAGHIHRLEEGDSPGYQMRCLATQNMMAVTAACLVTPRSLYEQLGGLNEADFKVAYNNIDY